MTSYGLETDNPWNAEMPVWTIICEEEKMYVTVDGNRVRKPNGDVFTHIISCASGRNASQIKLIFNNSTQGRHFNISDFVSSQSMNTLSSMDSSLGFQRKLETLGISLRKRPFLGVYNVSVTLLVPAEAPFQVRPRKRVWVDEIKSKMNMSAYKSTCTLPVMVDSKQVPIFNSADIGTYTFTVLGGNHVVQATKELMAENSENCVYSAFNVEVFHDLTIQEARSLANQHNVRNRSLPVTFQDNVRQARALFNEGIENLSTSVAEMLSDMTMKDVPRSSFTVLVSVAKYSEYQFNLVEEIIDNFEDVNGPGKSVPEKLFKTLMWPQYTSTKRSNILITARDHGFTKAVAEATGIKNMKLVKNTFKDAVMAKEWCEVENAYPQHASEETLKQFCKFPAGQQYMTKDLTEHIASAIQDRDPICKRVSNVDVHSTINGKQVDDKTLNIIRKEIEKITRKLQKLTDNDDEE